MVVFFHELPHEIGDYAIMLRSGLTTREAFKINSISGASAYLGWLITNLIGQHSSVHYLVAFGTGVMFYVINSVFQCSLYNLSVKEARQRIGVTCLGVVVTSIPLLAHFHCDGH